MPKLQPLWVSNPAALTPVERRGLYWFKRDDLFCVAGVRGGKVRTCWHLSQGAKGLITAGSRMSPQCQIVAYIAAHLGIPCRVHCPTGDLGPEVSSAQRIGAEVVQHRPGYNTVIVARARDDAALRDWVNIPFGMECSEAVRQTRRQVQGLPAGIARIVVPVGSGMSFAGVLHGLQDVGLSVPVLGVVIGANPSKRLDRFAPQDWRKRVDLVQPGIDYHVHARQTNIEGVYLDPIYEAKCIPFLRSDDLLWVIGKRGVDEMKKAPDPAPEEFDPFCDVPTASAAASLLR